MKTILLIAMLNGTCAQLSIMKRVNGVRARIGASPGNTFTHCYSKLNPRMLPNHEYPIPQREPLLRIIRNRRIHRSMSNRDACRRRNHPPNMLIRLVPHLDAKGEIAGISCKFGLASWRRIHPRGSTFRASAPKTLRRLAQLLKHAQRAQLTVRLVHENIMRTRLVEVKSVLSHVWPFHRQSDLG